MSAREYLEQSIVDPGAFVVEGFDGGRMPHLRGGILDDARVSALVDYLWTLQG